MEKTTSSSSRSNWNVILFPRLASLQADAVRVRLEGAVQGRGHVPLCRLRAGRGPPLRTGRPQGRPHRPGRRAGRQRLDRRHPAHHRDAHPAVRVPSAPSIWPGFDFDLAWFWCFFGDDRYSEGEIHFNLMAIVPDRIVAWQKELERLQVQSAAANGSPIVNYGEKGSLVTRKMAE